LQGKLYALKRIYAFHLKDPNYYKSIRREISIMQKLNHPNIVQLVDIYETENSLEILLEYLPGGNLFDKIKAQDRVPENVVRQYILEIVKAVKYLHSFP
jgi:serine/threonine protein kinase